MGVLTWRVKEVAKRINKRVNLALRPDPPKDSRRDLVYDLIQLHKEKPQFTESYLKKMAVTNFGAGHETMASTLTSIVALVASHPKVHSRLTREIRQHSHPTAYNTASQLPYMQAAIKESKRLRPVIGMSLPRRVPPQGLELHGMCFAPGTTVGCNSVALHRNEAICGPEPARFDPGRWLRGGSEGEAARQRMERYSLAWGGGARSCPGRHLAELIVDKVVATVFDEFDVHVEMPDEEGERTYFLSMMEGAKARFVQRTSVTAGTEDGTIET
jgi:cytochrome P450